MPKEYPYHSYYYPSDFKTDTERFERDAEYLKERIVEFKEDTDTVKKCSDILYSILSRIKDHNWDLKFLSEIFSKISGLKVVDGVVTLHSVSDLDFWISHSIINNESRLEVLQLRAKEQHADTEEFFKAIEYLRSKLDGGRAGGDPIELWGIRMRIDKVRDILEEILHDYQGKGYAPYHKGIIYKTLEPVGEQLKEKDTLINLYGRIQNELITASLKLNNEKELDAFLAFYEKLGFPMYKLKTEKFIKCQRKLRGISEKDSDLRNFDLKNTKDIERCKALYPLAKKYPDLFYGWYDNNGNILFEPTYSNGLEKKRKELHAKIEDKKAKTKSAFKRGLFNFVAKVIVPEKLRDGNAKFEQKVADVVYRKQRQGRK